MMSDCLLGGDLALSSRLWLYNARLGSRQEGKTEGHLVPNPNGDQASQFHLPEYDPPGLPASPGREIASGT